MSLINHNLVPDDLNSYWMPFTPNRKFKENPRFMVSAKGITNATIPINQLAKHR